MPFKIIVTYLDSGSAIDPMPSDCLRLGWAMASSAEVWLTSARAHLNGGMRGRKASWRKNWGAYILGALRIGTMR